MAAAPAHPTGSPMEALVGPSTRSGGRLPTSITELELLPGLTIENVLAAGVTWENFLRFLQGKFLWMTPDVYVIPRYVSGLGQSWVLGLGGYDIVTNMFVRVRSGTDAAAATATCDFLVRLLPLGNL
jgi:hypothetical protein